MSECNLCGSCSSKSPYHCGNSWLRCIRCGQENHEDHFYKTLDWPNAICEYCYRDRDRDIESCSFCDALVQPEKLVKTLGRSMCHSCIDKNKKVISFAIENRKKILEVLSSSGEEY
jgi:hypothetical protein